jgi:hypothetical protein
MREAGRVSNRSQMRDGTMTRCRCKGNNKENRHEIEPGAKR